MNHHLLTKQLSDISWKAMGGISAHKLKLFQLEFRMKAENLATQHRPILPRIVGES